MQTAELKEYLGIVVDMEENIYLQQKLKSNIEKRIEQLKIPRIFQDPVAPEKPTDHGCDKAAIIKTNFIFDVIGCIVLFFVSAIGVLLIGGAIGFLFYGDFEGADKVQNLLAPLIVIIPIIWVIYCVSDTKALIKRNDARHSEYLREMEVFQRETQDYQATIEANTLKRKQDEKTRQAKAILLLREREEIEKTLEASKRHLQEAYEKNIIFPKYRNLVMVCSLYEYICAGRCDTLEGHEGAYNILETEIRLDRIIIQLDKVITQLEKIQQNQFILYSAIQKSNQRISQIIDSTSYMASRLDDFYSNSLQLNSQAAELTTRIAELQQNSALAAYHAERTQKELAYMSRMDYLSGRNDDVFFNHPPV